MKKEEAEAIIEPVKNLLTKLEGLIEPDLLPPPPPDEQPPEPEKPIPYVLVENDKGEWVEPPQPIPFTDTKKFKGAGIIFAFGFGYIIYLFITGVL